MEYRVLTLFLLATQTSTCVAELTGDNVCPVPIREIVSLRVKVKEPVTIKSYTWCFRIPPRCSKYSVQLRDKFKIQHEPRTRMVAACCQGYAPDHDDRRCVALCSGGCVHGTCGQPENCTCEPGYTGSRCDQACEPGWHGVGCAQRCPCDNEASCHHVTGVCNCTSGWKGARCDVRCPQGNYGEGCLRQCRCSTSGKCNHVTGKCRAASPVTSEEVTSQAAAYRVSDDEGETSGPALTTTLRSPETLEIPPSTSPERGSDVEGKTSGTTYRLPETLDIPPSTSPERGSDVEGKTSRTTYRLPETLEIPPSTSPERGSDVEGKTSRTTYRLPETLEIPPSTSPERGSDVEGKTSGTTYRLPETLEIPPSTSPERGRDVEGKTSRTTYRLPETLEIPPLTSPERGSNVEGNSSGTTYRLPETSEVAPSTSPGRNSDEEGKAPKATYKFPETPEAPLSSSPVRGSDDEVKTPGTTNKLPETTEIPPMTWHVRSSDVESKTHRSHETSEVPPSTVKDRDSDGGVDLVKLPPTMEEHPTIQETLFIHDEPVTVTTTLITSTPSIEPSTNHLMNEAFLGKKLHSFSPVGYDLTTGHRSEDFVRLPEVVPGDTERHEDHTTVQYADNFLADEDSTQNHDKPPSPRTEDPGPADKDVILSGDDAAGVPPPSNDLQHLRQVKATVAEAEAEAGEPASGGGLLGRDLLSTSCVSAGVAVALIVTAGLIVAAAHWRKSGGKKAPPEDSKPASTTILAYKESLGDYVFSAHEVQTSEVSVTLDDSQPEHSSASGSVSTLQRNEQRRNCDFRDSMTSHYDIPPPARASLQAEGRGTAGDPIYEEIPGWNARATTSFLTFASVLETSRV